MSPISPFPEGQIESLSRLLGDFGTGDQITRALLDRGLEDHSGQSTKWKRLHWVFSDSQRQHGCANRIIDFIQSFLAPGRFVGNSSDFEDHRTKLNAILSFSGLEFGKDGNSRMAKMATTFDEAEARLKTIHFKLRGRSIHSEVTKYSHTELLQDNYFHAGFEASKGLAPRIHGLSGVQGDGAALVDKVFSVENPILASTFSKPTPRSPSTKALPNFSKAASPPSAIHSRTSQRFSGRAKTTPPTISPSFPCFIASSTPVYAPAFTANFQSNHSPDHAYH